MAYTPCHALSLHPLPHPINITPLTTPLSIIAELVIEMREAVRFHVTNALKMHLKLRISKCYLAAPIFLWC